jgi:hypothetical protein
MSDNKLPTLVVLWFVVNAIVVACDMLYVILRPATHPGGKYGDMIPFKYWHLYTLYDKRYGTDDDAWCLVQSYLNGAEVFLQFVAIVYSIGGNRKGLMWGLIVSIMTLYKTVIYFAMEAAENFKYTKHNSLQDGLLMVVLPSSFWITIPAIVAASLGTKLVGGTHHNTHAHHSSKKKN